MPHERRKSVSEHLASILLVEGTQLMVFCYEFLALCSLVLDVADRVVFLLQKFKFKGYLPLPTIRT
jgi:hypothetical protein